MSVITWKTQEEIDIEANAPQPVTVEEQLQAQAEAIMTLMEVMMGV